VYPKIEITEVVFQLMPDGYVINAQGDLPLYRNKQFEDGVKKWMKSQGT
jgi:CMP-2-keto-3-deoxyoctulosonic acid synthetase